LYYASLFDTLFAALSGMPHSVTCEAGVLPEPVLNVALYFSFDHNLLTRGGKTSQRLFISLVEISKMISNHP